MVSKGMGEGGSEVDRVGREEVGWDGSVDGLG